MLKMQINGETTWVGQQNENENEEKKTLLKSEFCYFFVNKLKPIHTQKLLKEIIC